MLSELFLILNIIRSDITILLTPEYSLKILQISSILNFVKIRQVGAKFLQVNRQTDITKLKVVLCNFSKAPKALMIRVTTRHVRVVIRTMDVFPVTCHPRAAEVHVGFQYPDARDGHF